MKNKVKIGVIGAGRIGKLHIDNLAGRVEGAEVAAVADIFMNDEMESSLREMGISKIYKEPEKIFEDSEIDAVFICSSTNTHSEFMIKAAKAGKHIFCEKPIDSDLGRIKEALKAVDEAGVKLQIGFVRRFDKNHTKVRNTALSGKLGMPHTISVISRDPGLAPMDYMKVSGGIYMDMTIHDFDMVRYLSGSEVVEVSAFGNVLIEPQLKEFDDVDTTIVMLRFENGAMGVIQNSRRSGYGYDQRVEVHCEKGSVQDFNECPDNAVISSEEGVVGEKPTWFFLERYNDAFIEEARQFVECIVKDTKPPVDGKDGYMPVLIAMAAKKSLDEKRAVKISEIPF
ncbi:MAG: inositol 2-dehydrogenase [Christensenellaceae bacterium]|jgi:myo-inositol 2-dehydrogenase/D-chiro-inositol 1-dehydrogenase